MWYFFLIAIFKNLSLKSVHKKLWFKYFSGQIDVSVSVSWFVDVGTHHAFDWERTALCSSHMQVDKNRCWPCMRAAFVHRQSPTVRFWVCLNAAVVYRVLWDETYASIFKSLLTVLMLMHLWEPILIILGMSLVYLQPCNVRCSILSCVWLAHKSNLWKKGHSFMFILRGHHIVWNVLCWLNTLGLIIRLNIVS